MTMKSYILKAQQTNYTHGLLIMNVHCEKVLCADSFDSLGCSLKDGGGGGGGGERERRVRAFRHQHTQAPDIS